MSALNQQLEQDMKNAMKRGDALRVSVLRMILASIRNRQIEKRAKTTEEMTDDEVIAALKSEAKKRRDAAVEFSKGGREDLAIKEKEELAIVESYLPAEMADDAIEQIVKDTLAHMGDISMKDFGRVMGGVMKRVKGGASGERVSAAVKRALG